MSRKPYILLLLCLSLFGFAATSTAQSITGSISGTVVDSSGAAVPNATINLRNIETNITRTVQSSDEGFYRATNLPVGTYEVAIEAANFGKYVQTGVTLQLNQVAVVDVSLKPAGVEEIVTVSENASLLNTTTAEVSTRFDSRRLSELPLATDRNVFNVALSAPGVSQLGAGQTGFASGVSYSSNGGRVRSNNFQIDGQDTNDPSVSGGQQSINNPDIVQEVRLITNQFLAEYGRNSGSVLNIITKAGTNDFNGSLFWFHNNNKLNALSNTDKARGLTEAPFRVENQIGATIGGPVYLPRFGEGGPAIFRGQDKTFFFTSFQRWSDRLAGSGTTLRDGAPTAEGRAMLQSLFGDRPQVQALLRFLPVAQTSTGARVALTSTPSGATIPVGSLTGSAALGRENYQISGRIDHNFSDANRLSGRYLYNDNNLGGSGQATPPGLTNISPSRAQSANISLTSVLSPSLVNEARIAYSRLGTTTTASDASSQEIPSIEIGDLGLQQFNASDSRTAIGLGVNLPQFRTNNTYQVQNNLSYVTGNHAMKFGVDARRTQVKSFFVPTIRGRLAYSTLARFIDDIADIAATVNRPLPGGQELQYYDYYDFYAFGQDEWKIRPNFTLTYGLRYETPGNSVSDLVPVNDAIVAAAGGNENFRFTPVPERDVNNFQPRIGFNYNPRTRDSGVLGFITGGDKLVFRGGYARTNDASFININLNIASAFPFVAAINLPVTTANGITGARNAFVNIPTTQVTNIATRDLARTIVGEDFRAPAYDQFTFEGQRELSRDIVVRVGYVGTRGTSLFQTIDGNPRRLGFPAATATDSGRVNPNLGTLRLRANSGSSTYNSLQTSFEKRLSRGFSGGVHYTYSSLFQHAS
ncbi:MAG: carboxypeptidase regulatory-like domain-containing protein [Pyrinomonadaceae bacterium MAG19_C2-C3]|nr:carboxypeptidase regulatory-like domain-containing protein [Pyrinomonadaceae bacterium MAG19_C2-C3]